MAQVSPMDQFKIHNVMHMYIGKVDISLNSSTLTMIATVSIILLFFYFGIKKPELCQLGYKLFVNCFIKSLLIW